MFGWSKRKPESIASDESVVLQPPNVIFPWPKGAVLTAVDELVLALPKGLFEKDRPLRDFVFGTDEMQINIPTEGDTFFIKLSP